MTTIRCRIALLAACAAFLSGCALIPRDEPVESAPQPEDAPQTSPSPVLPPPSGADSLLYYYQHLRALSAPALGREHDIARGAFIRTRADYDRIRLAMVLSLPGTPVNDESRALELLEPVARNPGSELQGLAFLIASHIQERRRLDANAQGLQQKLEALKLLERTMIERKR